MISIERRRALSLDGDFTLDGWMFYWTIREGGYYDAGMARSEGSAYAISAYSYLRWRALVWTARFAAWLHVRTRHSLDWREQMFHQFPSGRK